MLLEGLRERGVAVLIWGRGPQRSTPRLPYLLFPWVPSSRAAAGGLQAAWRGQGRHTKWDRLWSLSPPPPPPPPPRARSLPSAALTSCHHLASPTLAIPVHSWGTEAQKGSVSPKSRCQPLAMLPCDQPSWLLRTEGGSWNTAWGRGGRGRGEGEGSVLTLGMSQFA